MGADRTELHEHLRHLQELYHHHIAIEDQRLFPAAAQVLTKEQTLEIGREMAARRNVRLENIEARQRK
jgi:hemerythrin-like domain-containing protein